MKILVVVLLLGALLVGGVTVYVVHEGRFLAFIEETGKSADPLAKEFTEGLDVLLSGSGELPFGDERMLELLLPLAQKGDQRAQLGVGMIYSMGREIPADSEKAIYWFKKCADSGNAQAALILGAEYLKMYIADGSLSATENAAKYLKPQADKGNYEAQAMLGSLYCNLEAYGEALPYLEVTAPEGDAEAQATLGYMYFSGNGVARDLSKALYWSKEYLKTDNNSAVQVMVGAIYMEMGYMEDGGDDDFAKAYEYYTLSANSGEPHGYTALGTMYLFGKHVDIDVAKAKEYFEIGMKGGAFEAFSVRGKMFEFGFEEEVDIDKAIMFYKKAAELGCKESQQRLLALEEKRLKDSQ